MGQKASKAQSKKPQIPTGNQTDYAVYLLPNSEEKTLADAHLLVAAQTESYNAILLFPDPNDASSSSSGIQKYKACFICDGCWVRVGETRKEVSIGNQNFSHAKLMAPNAIPNYKSIINAVLARDPIQLCPFERVHPDTHKFYLSPNYDTPLLITVAKTSSTLYSLSRPELKKRIAKKLSEHVIKLSEHVIRGEQAQAEALLNKILKTHPALFPDIFKMKMKVRDYSGREFEKTVYQLALGAKDVEFHDEEVCMAEMLICFIRDNKEIIPYGEGMLSEQYNEQFPAGWEEKEAERAAIDSVELHKILDILNAVSETECQAVHGVDDEIQKLLRKKKSKSYNPEKLRKINQAVLHSDKDNFEVAFNHLRNYLEKERIVSDASFQFDALKALYQFRNYLESQTKVAMKYSFHFNENLLIDALMLYDENYERFDRFCGMAKSIVSWCKIVGYIQRFVPACLAQAMHQGFYSIVHDGEKLQRLTEFRHGMPYKIFPLDADSSRLLGYDFAAVAGCVRDSRGARTRRGLPLWIAKLMLKKNINVAGLMQHPGSQPKNIPAMR